MWTQRTLSAHQAQISVHNCINPSPCRLTCSELRYHRRLVHACASRLKQLSPAAVEDTSADEIALEVFEWIRYTESAPEPSNADSKCPADVQNAATDSRNSLQQRRGTASWDNPPHLQPLSDDWTESNDDDISNAVKQLVRPLPKPAVAKDSRNFHSVSSSSSVLLPEPLQANPKKELVLEIQDGDEHYSESSLTGAQGYPRKAAAAAGAIKEQAVGEVQELLPPGSFFASRATLLAQLQQQQRQLQRQLLLHKQRKNLYTYALSASGEVTKVRRPGLKSPLQQTQFKLAKGGAQANDDSSSSSTTTTTSSSSSTTVGGKGEADTDTADDTINARKDTTRSVSNAADSQIQQQQQQQQQRQRWQQQQQQQQQLQLQQQWSELADQEDLLTELQQTPTSYLSTSSTGGTGSIGHSGSSSSSSSISGTGGTMYDPSRGLCLSAFLYCCSRSTLLTLTWQLGLPPGALKFITKVSDADLVLHVKPRRGERHYQYDDFRQQAAAKGIPFVDLKNLSLQELQLYLLPVFCLYAGEVSPRDLLKRKKRRGWKRRYTNIKLPPA